MAFVTWDETFSVGVDLIDKQHQELFGFINAFHEDRANLEHTIEDLLSYIDFHFKTEEKYFKEFGYEKTEEHEDQHKFYEDKVRAFFKQFLQGNTSISEEVENFVRDWIVHHIKTVDKEYTKCFNEHGLK